MEYSDWETGLKEEVLNFDKVKAYTRKDLQTCNLCGISYGLCIKCDDTKCNFKFHICCAIKDGLIRADEDMPKKFEDNDP